MDVLKPPLIYIDGRCYRINNPDYDSFDTKHSSTDWDEHPNTYGYNECTADEPCDGDDEFEITVMDTGRYKTSFHVPRTFYGPIVGVRGQTRKRLEDETRTNIFVPKKMNEHEIVITGPTRSSVASARRRVSLIVMSYRRKHEATHFISIPMVGRKIKAGFMEFKKQVLETCGQARGIEESIFQSADRLHLTLCTLVLVDKVERDEASRILDQCKRDIIDPVLEHRPLKLKLAGIEYMNDDPAEVDVLYARVHFSQGDNILQTLVDNIVDYFAESGLMEKQYDKVKLHLTVMNTLFRDSRGGYEESKGKDKRARQTFNAVPVFEKFRDFVFGEDVVDTIHLSQRLTYSRTGYYQDTHSIILSA